MFSTLPVLRVDQHPLAEPLTGWPGTLAPVAQLLASGLNLGAVTILTGENGSGKSTLLEAIAIAYGLNAEGGTTDARHGTLRAASQANTSETMLAERLRLVRGAGAAKQGFFLRAETMHSFYTYLDGLDDLYPEASSSGDENSLHLRSHGESFLEVSEDRLDVPGLWLMDEPEAALSVSGCLGLLAMLKTLVERGSQVIISTHSPLLAAFPSATLLELGPWGMRESSYDDLELVSTWRLFLDAPERFLRHL